MVVVPSASVLETHLATVSIDLPRVLCSQELLLVRLHDTVTRDADGFYSLDLVALRIFSRLVFSLGHRLILLLPIE